ncbi:MAG: hypothetical protein AABZ61_10990, partial [Bacteroidota bacterium]
MKLSRSFLSVWFFLILLAVAVTPLSAQPPDKTQRNQPAGLFKASGAPTHSILNINNFTTWVRSDGGGDRSPHGDYQGYYPRGMGNAIYSDGLVWGARCFINPLKVTPAPRQPIRIGGKTYRNGQKAGRVIGFRFDAVPQDPNDPAVRVYRIRRDYTSMSLDEYRRDAAETFEVFL